MNSSVEKRANPTNKESKKKKKRVKKTSSMELDPYVARHWAMQCNTCKTWREMPTKQLYEEIRSTYIQRPFTCDRLPNTSCQDPPSLEYDNSRLWAFDQVRNLPVTPEGFNRQLRLKRDCSRFKCYYIAPDGTKLRSSNQVRAFLSSNQDRYSHLSEEDFNFSVPYVRPNTLYGPDE